MKQNPLHIAARILRIILVIIISLFLTYSVLFSIAGTVALVMGYKLVTAPIRQVQILKTGNPGQTAFMKQYRRENSLDTLLHTFVPLDSISPNLVSAVIAAEDDGFYTHPGIDLEAIIQATEYNRSQGEVKRGASTITQQLAKNLFLSKERSYERKIKELAYTLLMERYLGKERILELYLNYAQWGKNIFGCEAATRYYFKKSCGSLTRNEAARLAATLAMPSKMSPHNTKSVFMGKRITVIANNLYLHKIIDDSGYFGLTGTMPPPKEGAKSTENKKPAHDTVSADRNIF